MSYKWPDKDPDEIVDFSIDWSRFLDTDTISSVDWFIDAADGTKTQVTNADIVNGLQFVSGTNTQTVSTIRVSLGTTNTRYNITCRITTATGLRYERSVFLRIREK